MMSVFGRVLGVRRLARRTACAHRSTRGHVALDDLGAELLGLRAHLGHQVRAHDAVAMPGKVLDERRQHELTAGLEPFDESGCRLARAVYSAAVRPAGPTR